MRNALMIMPHLPISSSYRNKAAARRMWPGFRAVRASARRDGSHQANSRPGASEVVQRPIDPIGLRARLRSRNHRPGAVRPLGGDQERNRALNLGTFGGYSGDPER